MDTNESVTPHRLCGVCRAVAGTYKPPKSWTGEDAHAFFQERGIPVEKGASISDIRKSKAFQSVYLGPFTDLDMFWASRRPMEHHARVSDLRSSAERGCHLCSLLVGDMDRRKVLANSDRTRDRLWLSPSREPTGHTKTEYMIHDEWFLLLHDSGPSRVFHSARFLAKVHICHCSKVPRQHGPLWGNWIRGKPSPAVERVPLESSHFRWSLSTGSNAAVDLIGAWIRQCTDNHEACRTTFSDCLPSRLLDLDADLDAADIRLVSTRDIGKQSYATLSYAWGKSSSVLLTEDSIEIFKARISVRPLPKTIRHAIRVCRMLQVRYLWVDALCIIQNRGQDFAQEVSQMGAIYANSLFTIAASNATDCSQGFLADRKPLQVEDCHILENAESVILFANTYHVNTYHHLYDQHLETRAWVFQERTMSPRTIHFCGSEIVWECREWVMCQRCAVSLQPSAPICRTETRKDLVTKLLDTASGNLRLTDFERIWNRMLGDYTRSRLSNEDDRLSALGGIVQLMNRQSKHKSSFGLWHPIFLKQLLWYSWLNEHDIWQGRKDVSGIPSWSWVSVRDATHQIHQHWVRATELYSAEVLQLPLATSFGQISTLGRQLSLPASVKIRGWATTCRAVPPSSVVTYRDRWSLTPVSRSRQSNVTELQNLSWYLYLCGTSCTKEQKHIIQRLGCITKGRFYAPDERPTKPEDLVCLFIKRTWSGFKGKARAAQMLEHGLVLKCIDTERNVYRREGLLMLFSGYGHNKAMLLLRLHVAQKSANEHRIHKAQQDYETCREIMESKDEKRIQKLLIDRYSFFNEDEPKIEVEII